MKILILHGPNLNLLGQREKIIYGSDTQNELFDSIKNHFPEIDFSFFQSNHEGKIIDNFLANLLFYDENYLEAYLKSIDVIAN